MRFCDFFIEYKIGLKEIQSTIPFMKLPFYRKIAIVLLFIIGSIDLIFTATGNIKGTIFTFITMILLIIIFLLIDSKKENLRKMLEEHYSPHSKERMDMLISVFNKFHLAPNDSNTIDLLIAQTKEEQVECDYLAPLKKPFKILGTIIIPIVVYVTQKLGDATSLEELLTVSLQAIAIIICIFAIILAIIPIIKELLYRDYNKYNELLYDLKQLKIFYSSKSNNNF